VIEGAYFGTDGEATLYQEGFARSTSAYDTRGNLVERAYFGVKGEPILSRIGAHRRRMDLDSLGRPLSIRYFGLIGEPVIRSNVLIENDHITEVFGLWRDVILSGLLSSDDLAAAASGGFHEARYSYDSRGNVTERWFLDNVGRAGLGPDGFSGEAIEYDALSRPVRFRLSRLSDSAGPVSVAVRYDARGNAEAVAYLDRADRPANGAQGFARAELAHNQFGGLVSVHYFTADGKRFDGQDAIAA
jgi:hypothetical protein